MPKFLGRRKPYTAGGINRIACARCGRPSTYQWSTCANNHHYLGFCEDCDVAMNAMVLAFIGTEHATTLMTHYMERIEYDGSHPAFTVQVPAQVGPRVVLDCDPDPELACVPDAKERQADWVESS